MTEKRRNFKKSCTLSELVLRSNIDHYKTNIKNFKRITQDYPIKGKLLVDSFEMIRIFKALLKTAKFQLNKITRERLEREKLIMEE